MVDSGLALLCLHHHSTTQVIYSQESKWKYSIQDAMYFFIFSLNLLQGRAFPDGRVCADMLNWLVPNGNILKVGTARVMSEVCGNLPKDSYLCWYLFVVGPKLTQRTQLYAMFWIPIFFI